MIVSPFDGQQSLHYGQSEIFRFLAADAMLHGPAAPVELVSLMSAL